MDAAFAEVASREIAATRDLVVASRRRQVTTVLREGRHVLAAEMLVEERRISMSAIT
ncbi:MAG: hypothetical protein ACLUW6_08670 [Coriobacteriaceae bacterium]